MSEFTAASKKGISSSTLKLIAITAMLIDHIGAVVLEPVVMQSGTINLASGNIPGLFIVDMFLRLVIGRIAFPIFCFMLVEGFQRTSNVYKYAIRLLGFAVLSEIPFDLAVNGSWMDNSYQNVFFTLFFGLLVMILAEKADSMGRNKWFAGGLKLVCLLAGMAGAWLLHTDYGAYGVFCIAVLYFFQGSKKKQLLAGSAAFIGGDLLFNGGLTELLSPLGFLAVAQYNGERGLRMKYVFYLFYPVHLLVLYGVRLLIL